MKSDETNVHWCDGCNPDNCTGCGLPYDTHTITPRKRDMNKPVKTPDHVALAALAKQRLAHVPIFTLPKQVPKTQKEEKR